MGDQNSRQASQACTRVMICAGMPWLSGTAFHVGTVGVNIKGIPRIS